MQENKLGAKEIVEQGLAELIRQCFQNLQAQNPVLASELAVEMSHSVATQTP